MPALSPFRPLARFDDLVINQLAHEMLVFDQRSNAIHQLDGVSGATWRLSDGQRTAGELARLVSRELGETVSAEAIDLALGQLSDVGLLVTPKAATGSRESRRSLLRKAAVGGAMVVPAIVSVSAPQAAAAQSCEIGVVCVNDDYCCPMDNCDGAGNCCFGGFVCENDGVCCEPGQCTSSGTCCRSGTVCQNDGTCCPGTCDGNGRCCVTGVVCSGDQGCCLSGVCNGAGNCCPMGTQVCGEDRACCPLGQCVDGTCLA